MFHRRYPSPESRQTFESRRSETEISPSTTSYRRSCFRRFESLHTPMGMVSHLSDSSINPDRAYLEGTGRRYAYGPGGIYSTGSTMTRSFSDEHNTDSESESDSDGYWYDQRSHKKKANNFPGSLGVAYQDDNTEDRTTKSARGTIALSYLNEGFDYCRLYSTSKGGNNVMSDCALDSDSELLENLHKLRMKEGRLSEETKQQIKATIYGNCVGDAIGLLTEFMTKSEVQMHYGKYGHRLELEYKISDSHRRRWKIGDWTDDSDQMILIMQSLTERGKVEATDFASKLDRWCRYGFKELGDKGGQGVGHTTASTLQDPCFKAFPHQAAKCTWEESGRKIAPNGAVMRTSILGIHEFWNLPHVQRNAKEICKTTHYDPRCQASAVAVSVAIALMLQREPPYFINGEYRIDKIVGKCYECAATDLSVTERSELRQYLTCTCLEELKLDEPGKIGYTYKCLGAGFWALRQRDFRTALTEIVKSGGDADTNGAVAGALLGCKLGDKERLPRSWRASLIHKGWLDGLINRYMDVLNSTYKSRLQIDQPSIRVRPKTAPPSTRKVTKPFPPWRY